MTIKIKLIERKQFHIKGKENSYTMLHQNGHI